jgi:hypothetical protein
VGRVARRLGRAGALVGTLRRRLVAEGPPPRRLLAGRLGRQPATFPGGPRRGPRLRGLRPGCQHPRLHLRPAERRCRRDRVRPQGQHPLTSDAALRAAHGPGRGRRQR